MVYIHKETFDMIRTDLPRIKESDEYFEVDELIAPIIQILNRKGYITEACCAGHPFPFATEGYMYNDPEKKVFESLSPLSPSAYIMFKEGIALPSIPPKFKFEEINIQHDDSDENHQKHMVTIRKWYISIEELIQLRKIDTYAFIRNIIETMEQLHEWALGLPDFQGEL